MERRARWANSGSASRYGGTRMGACCAAMACKGRRQHPGPGLCGGAAQPARIPRDQHRSTSSRRWPRRGRSRSSPATTSPPPSSARWACRFRWKAARRVADVHRAFMELAQKAVRYVGEPIAFVVLPGRSPRSQDAAELIEIDYEILPSVTTTKATPRRPRSRSGRTCPDNISNLFEAGEPQPEFGLGRRASIDRRLRSSTRSMRISWSRAALISVTRTRARSAAFAPTCSTRTASARRWRPVFEIEFRVGCGDVGGGFGTKGWRYEHRLVLLAARMLRRPIKWSYEAAVILADEHAATTSPKPSWASTRTASSSTSRPACASSTSSRPGATCSRRLAMSAR